MKKMMQLTMAGIVMLLFANTQVSAHNLDLEDDMAEGLVLSESKSSTASYTYDSLNAEAEESMTEAVFFPEAVKDSRSYAGDPSIPSVENLMAEGICMKTFSPLVAQQ